MRLDGSTGPGPGERPPSIGEVLAWLRETRFSAGPVCPRCASTTVLRWGGFSGRQRYRCKGCGRTFSDLTGTPAAYRKKLTLWPGYAACMAQGWSLRRSAAHLHVNLSTSFFWRHAIASWQRAHGVERLGGWIEVDSISFAYSEKGRRHASRAPAARAARSALMDERPRVSVLVASDRLDGVLSILLFVRRPETWHVALELAPRLEPDSRVVGPYASRPLSTFFGRRGLGRFHDARSTSPECRLPFVHLRTVRACIARLRRWLVRFRGVATKYLPNYLAWHHVVDLEWRNAVGRLLLRWPASTPRPASGIADTPGRP